MLPFQPLIQVQARNDRDASLEIGMADTLIARLRGIRNVIVRPLSSVRRFCRPGTSSEFQKLVPLIRKNHVSILAGTAMENDGDAGDCSAFLEEKGDPPGASPAS